MIVEPQREEEKVIENISQSNILPTKDENEKSNQTSGKNKEQVYGMDREEYLKMPRSQKIKLLEKTMKEEDFNKMFGKKKNKKTTNSKEELHLVEITVPEVEEINQKQGKSI
jgi:hypothetical protein